MKYRYIRGLAVLQHSRAAFVNVTGGLKLGCGRRSLADVVGSRRAGTLATTATMSSGPAVWDDEAGVWVGGKAAGHEGDVPSPLWIFGYGSLCWRPEESFAGFERFDGEVVGWKRLFAQRSMDHRGTPKSPGLVATLVSDADLEALGERSNDDPPSRTQGVAYLVPDERVEEVLAGLDFREKGGYTRAVVDMFPAGGRARGAAGGQSENTAASIGTTGTSTSPPGGGVGADSDGGVSAPRQALLYTATTDNPNFFLPSVEEAAGIIASAVGPSGPNHEYLLSLSEYMNKVGAPDPYLDELSGLVRSRMASLARSSS